jgi:hypothetical protein
MDNMDRKRYIYKFNSQEEYYLNKNTIMQNPSVVLIRKTKEVVFEDYETEYFTIMALEDSDFNVCKPINVGYMYYSLNNEEWVEITDAVSFPIKKFDKIKFKGNGNYSSDMCSSIFNLQKFNAEGNIMSLIYGDDFIGKKTFSSSSFGGEFQYLFAHSNIVSAKNLILPALELTEKCYRYMFSGCKSLIQAPTLNAPKLVKECYESMFELCESLIDIKMMALDISAENCMLNWVNHVANRGTFTKHALMTSLTNGVNGIPTNWDEVIEGNELSKFTIRLYSNEMRTYICEYGHNWEEYVNSKYNSDFSIVNGLVCYHSTVLILNADVRYNDGIRHDVIYDVRTVS